MELLSHSNHYLQFNSNQFNPLRFWWELFSTLSQPPRNIKKPYGFPMFSAGRERTCIRKKWVRQYRKAITLITLAKRLCSLLINQKHFLYKIFQTLSCRVLQTSKFEVFTISSLVVSFKREYVRFSYVNYLLKPSYYTVKPLYSGHHRDLKVVSVLEMCPLHRGSS